MLYIISKTIALAGDPSKSSNNNGKRIKKFFLSTNLRRFESRFFNYSYIMRQQFFMYYSFSEILPFYTQCIYSYAFYIVVYNPVRSRRFQICKITPCLFIFIFIAIFHTVRIQFGTYQYKVKQYLRILLYLYTFPNSNL
jgi:hypothetical protein